MQKCSIPALGMTLAAVAWPASYYTVRLEDPKAVYLTREAFPVRGDGVADDTNAIQQAIDKVQETTNEGIVFIPEGRYRLTHTVYVWPGLVRPRRGPGALPGGGETAGLQEKGKKKPVVFLRGRAPRRGARRGRSG